MRDDEDNLVEQALFKRACGYDAEDTVIEENERGVKERVSRYHIPGDVRAMIFWLQNRNPERWKNRPEAEEARTQKGVHIIDDIA